jgi:GntR family transcriptional regulator
LPTRKLVRNPLYEQLKQILGELATSDEFRRGDRFLTERQISERFDVSRVTANKALASLVAEGVLAIRKGVGTFVADNASDSRFPSVATSFTNKTLAAGKRPSTRILRFQSAGSGEMPARVRQRLPLSPGEPMIVVERLRLADEVPMILERHYLRAQFLPGLVPDDVVVSLYDTLTKKYRLPLAIMDERIRSVVIGGANARLLGVPEMTPGILMLFMPILEDGTPLYSAEVLYRGDAYEFHNRLGPIQRTHSPIDDPEEFTPGQP